MQRHIERQQKFDLELESAVNRMELLEKQVEEQKKRVG